MDPTLKIERMREAIRAPFAITSAVIHPDGSATIEVLQTFTGIRRDFKAPPGGYFDPVVKSTARLCQAAVFDAECTARKGV